MTARSYEPTVDGGALRAQLIAQGLIRPESTPATPDAPRERPVLLLDARGRREAARLVALEQRWGNA